MTTPATDKLPPERLRELFLFENLTDDQLRWLSEASDVVAVEAGTELVREGETARCFYVLLTGTLTMSKKVRGLDTEVTRSDQPGVYAGATQFYMGDQVDQVYGATIRAVVDSTFLALPAEEFAVKFREWYPMAVHLLQGMFVGIRNSNELVGQRERLLALGKLTAGLTHELNNPAAAAVRATGDLRERVAGMRHKLAKLADGRVSGELLKQLTGLQEEFVAKVAKAPALTAMETSDREDELSDWLDDHSVPGAFDMAATLVAGGVTVDDLEKVAAETGDHLPSAVHWLTYTVETETLMGEITDSVERISGLVGAAKQYSQMDRTPHQQIDVHEGIDSTLVMLSSKLGDKVHVVKEYDRGLPAVPAYAAELNQVWTNLIDNAVDAMHGEGTLTVRTSRDGDKLLVEVGDTGPGVPDDIKQRIFEPFFTTKQVGHGTGLGLDVSWRIVVKRHGGDLRVESRPGDTRFQVRLPFTEPAH